MLFDRREFVRTVSALAAGALLPLAADGKPAGFGSVRLGTDCLTGEWVFSVQQDFRQVDSYYVVSKPRLALHRDHQGRKTLFVAPTYCDLLGLTREQVWEGAGDILQGEVDSFVAQRLTRALVAHLTPEGAAELREYGWADDPFGKRLYWAAADSLYSLRGLSAAARPSGTL